MDVSVVMPVYNAAPFVAAAVHSALQQPEVRQVVLVEDGSSDDSLAVCKRLAHAGDRVELHVHPGGANRGASASRNLGMERSTMAFVAFLDADDLYLPGRFAAEHAIFREHPDADGVYGAIGAHFHDDVGRERFEQQFNTALTTVRQRVAPDSLFEAFIGLHEGVRNVGHFSLDALTIRRSSLRSMPMLMREDLGMHEDSEFIIRMSYYLRLYPGSTERAVASRGVHMGNRITAVPRKGHAVYLQDRALAEWAAEADLPKRFSRKLKARCMHSSVVAAEGAKGRVSASFVMLANPALWKRKDTWNAYITLMAGKGSWLARNLYRGVARVLDVLIQVKAGKTTGT